MNELQTEACFQPGAVKLCPMPVVVNRLVSWEHKTQNVKLLFSIQKNPYSCFYYDVKCHYFKLLCNSCTLSSWLILYFGFAPTLFLLSLWIHCHLADGAVSREKEILTIKAPFTVYISPKGWVLGAEVESHKICAVNLLVLDSVIALADS